jgi:hypothetical protein
MFNEAIGAAAQTVPDGAAGVHHTFHSRCGPVSLRPRPVRPQVGYRWSPGDRL